MLYPKFENIPQEIRGGEWYAWKTKSDGTGKIPYNKRGVYHDNNRKGLSFDDAVTLCESDKSFKGVSRKPNAVNDGYIFGDIDGRAELPKGWPPATYHEKSPGGKGLRCIWHADDIPEVDINDAKLKVEMYSGHGRVPHITFTGHRTNRLKIKHLNGECAAWVAKYERSRQQDISEIDFKGITPEDDLEPVAALGGRISLQSVRFLEDGTCDTDRSTAAFKAVMELLGAGVKEEDAAGYLIPYAMDKRNNNAMKAIKLVENEIKKAKASLPTAKTKEENQETASEYEVVKTWIKESDENTILEEWISKLSEIETRSPIQEELTLKALKTKTGITLPTLRQELKEQRFNETGELEEERTHMEIAQAFIDEVLKTDYPQGVISVNGIVYTVEGNIWKRTKHNDFASDVGKTYRDARCARSSDYKAISELIIHEIAEDSDFFLSAPPGIASIKGFHCFDKDNNVKVEKLDAYKHRAQFLAPAPPVKRKGKLWHTFINSSIKSSIAKETESQHKLLQEALGAILFGLLIHHKKVLLFIGEGDSGKSMLQRLLEQFFAEDLRASVAPSDWKDGQYRSALIGKRINLAGDIPDNKMTDTAMFKRITGDDRWDAKEVYKPIVTGIRNTASHIFSSNDLPRSRPDKAFMDRWILIHFPVSIAAKDRIFNLEGKILKDEAGELIYWAMQGAQRLLKQGWTSTVAQDELLEQWGIESDSVLEYLKDTDANELTYDDKDKETTNFLYENYMEWSKRSARKAVGRNTFHKRTRKLLARKKTGGIDYYFGIHSVRNFFNR